MNEDKASCHVVLNDRARSGAVFVGSASADGTILQRKRHQLRAIASAEADPTERVPLISQPSKLELLMEITEYPLPRRRAS